MTISRKILEELIEVKFFEFETRISETLDKLNAPAVAKAINAMEMSLNINKKQDELNIKIHPFLVKVDKITAKYMKLESVENDLLLVKKNHSELVARVTSEFELQTKIIQKM